MASWIAKPWIEQALMSETGKNLPKIARAQILKFDETSHYTIAFISDKEFFVKAVFSQAAVEQFKRDNPTLSMADIQGGLIFIKKYSLEGTCTTEKDLSTAEFVMKIDLFKFAGGEGNTQFGSDVIDSSKYPPLQPRLHELCTLSQFTTLLYDKSFDAREAEGGKKLSSIKELERTLLENHEPVFIPEDMEKKLATIPEWQPSYRPPLSCNMQSEMTSFGDTPSSGRGQAQISASSMAVDCGQLLQLQEKMIIPGSSSASENRNLSQSRTASKDKGFRIEKTVEETIGAKSQKMSDWTKVACSLQKNSTRRQESSSLFKEIKGALSSISTLEKQNQREETVFRFDDTAAYLESCRKSDISCAFLTRGEQLVASSSQRVLKPTTKQTDVKRLEKWEFLGDDISSQVKEKARNGNCLKMAGQNILSSKGYLPASYVPERSNQAGMLQGLGQYHFPEYHVKGKGNDLATEQEEIPGALISSDVVSSSQMSGKVTPPLKGVVAEDQCSSLSEQSQLKGSSEELFSILKKSSLPSSEKRSPEIFVVPSSDNSEEYEQALPSILPGQAAKHLCCSLSESQLENLLESSISYDVDSAPPCIGNEPRESQKDYMYTKIKQGPLTQRESTPQRNQLGNTKVNPDSSQLKNSTASEPCIASKKDLSPIHNMANSSPKEKYKHKGKGLEVDKHVSNSTTVQSNVDQTLSKPLTMNFDELFSQNTWHFSQISDRQLSVNEAEADSHQSMKRKRSEMEGHVQSIPPSGRQGNKVLLSDSPASPDSSSHSVKSDSHSGSSQNHINSLSPSIYLTKPMELYSQQDPLVLNSSTESLENMDSVIDNESGLLINGSDTQNGHGNTSLSILDHSITEPSTLKTPTFDSLPSFQVPADKGETPTSRVQKDKVGHSATRDKEAEIHQDPGNNKKKRKPRRRKFNWFSDLY